MRAFCAVVGTGEAPDEFLLVFESKNKAAPQIEDAAF
jgi:hypothetical protein